MHIYISSFYRHVNPEATANCVLVNANRCSGLKVMKKKENRETAN